MLEVRELCAGYGAVDAVRSVDLTIDESDFMMILGPNGAGKSTLVRTLMGVHPASSGSVVFEGEDVTHLATHKRHRRGITYIPEGRGIVDELTVEENLDLARFSKGWTPSRRASSLDSFPVLGSALRRKASQLSGGEKQMLALARAWETGPRLLLLDEPSLGLAPVIVEQVLASLDSMRAAGVALIVVEEREQGLARLSTKVAVMSGGAIRDISPGDGSTFDVTFDTYLGATT